MTFSSLVSQSVNQGTVNPTYIQKMDVVLNEKPQIVMVVIPNNKVRLCLSKFLMFNSRFLQGEHYAAIKRVCIMENPIPSQCITSTVLK